MKFQIVSMEQRDKSIILQITGISPLEKVTKLQQWQEQMKSQVDGLEADEQKMFRKIMQPMMTTICHLIESDNQSQFRGNLTTTLILDEEKFQNLGLNLGDFITFEIKKVDRTKLSKE